MKVTSHGETVRATPGSYTFANPDGSYLIADAEYPLPIRRRVRVHGGGRVRIELGERAVEVGAAFRRPDDDRRRRSAPRAYSAMALDGSGRRWGLRLPRRLPRAADRLSIGVTYRVPDGTGLEEGADFEAGIRRHRHRRCAR